MIAPGGLSLADAVAALDAGLGDSPADAGRIDAGDGGIAAAASRYVLFTIAETCYAVHETLVTELDRVPKITLVPHVPAWVRGVANLRGDVISVVDLRAFLGLDAAPIFRERMLVVRLVGEDFTTALVVDNVERIVAIADTEIRPTEAPVEGRLSAYLRGVAVAGARLVAVLDLDRLLRSPEIRQFEERLQGEGAPE